ncbi:SRPBCC family protein [Spirosoma sp. BT702]|uniref:SRPBCC family protein n=1 Tax=Spirosoma profusum TaxID=2771354 RepID=A0A926Y3I6_9BACT|nr:SRPBCC family protein [Spirosoma profusum]MBD2701856.1 SRPBCC family protein [Spirosoma profusum]
MSVLLLETAIKAKPEVCYKLSLSVDLHQLSTQKTGEHIVGGVRQGIMRVGDTVTWKAKHFGVWQTLTTQITDEKPFDHFVDEMLQGAFKSMKHEHYFVETNYGTLMRDVFRFESPLGLLGRFFNLIILENYMKRFLLERNQTIREIAESGQWRSFIPDVAL